SVACNWLRRLGSSSTISTRMLFSLMTRASTARAAHDLARTPVDIDPDDVSIAQELERVNARSRIEIEPDILCATSRHCRDHPRLDRTQRQQLPLHPTLTRGLLIAAPVLRRGMRRRQASRDQRAENKNPKHLHRNWHRG